QTRRRVLHLRLESADAADEAAWQRARHSGAGCHGAGNGLRTWPLLPMRTPGRGRRARGAGPRLDRWTRVRSAGGGWVGSNMAVKMGSVTLKNPIMPASGAFSTEVAQVMDIDRLGALVTKTVSREYRIGNPPPRVAELEGGMINSIGLPGKGIGYFLDHQLPEYKRYTPPLVANITATTADDFAAMAREVTLPAVDVIDMNISCPTREPGGGNFALHEDQPSEIVRRVRAATNKPLWAKLSPNAGEIDLVAKAAERAGADALTISNTILGLKINTETFKPMIGNGYGGISGPGIKRIIMT